MQMNGEEIDVEALQAQIDLSNSVAYDLVSSWMKPTSSKAPPTSVSMSIARELEEHAKRPPRLGLGASVSKASAATARDAAKLKGKLIGTKRARDEGENGASTSAAGPAQEEEDDGESRSAAISTKKLKVNGTGSHVLGLGKRGKGKAKATETQSSKHVVDELVSSTDDGIRKKKHKEERGSPHMAPPKPPKPNPFAMPQTPTTVSVINLISPSPTQNTAPTQTPSSAKKKKHRKHFNKSQAGEDEEWHGFSIDAQDDLSNLILSADNKSPPEQATLHPTPSSAIDPTSTVQPMPSPSRTEFTKLPASKPSRILNLNTPPSPNTESEDAEGMERAASESPKKKRPRRRRGKNRKNIGKSDGE